MKKILLTLFVFSSLFSQAQNPLVKQWDARFGGNGTDWLNCFMQTNDGGFILGGNSYSGISGDKTQNSWNDYDYWIVKIDALGNKQWDKDFGGYVDDYLYSIQQTTDGGYILGGYSDSWMGGDKTQSTWGGYDYWIVKIDSNGIKQWDKDYGGTGIDGLRSLQQTTDGGYILGGYSSSGISGDKTQASRGSDDYWIVKVDALGNKQWDKDFGGISGDDFYSLEQTTDGGYILGGLSGSGVGGDKTQASWGNNDYWIIKIDSNGTKQWDKDFGGAIIDYLLSLHQTTDGGYILGGFSGSGVGGDKTQASWGSLDYWIVKIDSNGIKQWDKDFGGTNVEDDFGSVVQTTDGGYFLCGDSFSPISGNKTETNLGQSQAWVVKTDSLGNKEWDKTIFTNPEIKVYPYALQTKEGCYAIAESTFGSIAGDKTQANRDTTNGSQDYWIIKFCDSTLQPIVALTATNFVCPGACIVFTNLSLYAISYQWSFSGATPPTSTDVNPQNICYATPGTYDVQLIATNANGSDTLTLANYINVYPTPPPQSITQNGDSLFAIAGATSYQWYFNTNIINGATNYFYVAPTSGDYNVVATDANGCEVEAAVFNVVAAAPPIPPEGEVTTAAPNPVTDKLFLINSFSKEKAEIKIYNMLGEVVLNFPTSNIQHLTSIDVSTLSKGIFYFEINTGNKILRTKFVKQ